MHLLKCIFPGKDTHHHHQCGFEALEKGFGYDDLNKWANNMTPLDFEIEFINVRMCKLPALFLMKFIRFFAMLFFAKNSTMQNSMPLKVDDSFPRNVKGEGI